MSRGNKKKIQGKERQVEVEKAGSSRGRDPLQKVGKPRLAKSASECLYNKDNNMKRDSSVPVKRK